MTKRLLATAILLLLSAVGFTMCATVARAQNKLSSEKWETRGDFEYRDFDLRPTGWPQGNKSAPENCGLTPEQAGKNMCKTFNYQGRVYYYYRDENGKIHARRPVVQQYTTPGKPTTK